MGALVALAGVFFTLQAFGVVPTPSSFMYRNPQWILQGAFIFVVGLVVAAMGVAMIRRKQRRKL